MIDVRQITRMHRDTVIRWHDDAPDNPYEGLLAAACDQHRYNFLLWHEEDIARSTDVGAERIAAAKRAIDQYNQQRNDSIEKLDDELAELLQQRGITAAADAALNTETPGSAIDRLSILALRIYHLEEQLQRVDVNADHLDSVRTKLAICQTQHAELSLALETLLKNIAAGRIRHRTYHQLKMYNDPTLNPYLYGARKRSA